MESSNVKYLLVPNLIALFNLPRTSCFIVEAPFQKLRKYLRIFRNDTIALPTNPPPICVFYDAHNLYEALMLPQKSMWIVVSFAPSLTCRHVVLPCYGLTFNLKDPIIPPVPYQIRGHHVFIHEEWVEQLAKRIELSEEIAPEYQLSPETPAQQRGQPHPKRKGECPA